MSSLVRLLSKRRSGRRKKGDYTANSSKRIEDSTNVEPLKGYYICSVTLLDGSEYATQIQKSASGSELFAEVLSHLDLSSESDYFGLQFLNADSINEWLEPNKSLKKQLKGLVGVSFKFRFRVKFYSSEPTKLHGEITRYYFFLQLKSDILQGRLPCNEHHAVQLAAFALQSELGDYDPAEHDLSLVSEFRFVPRQSDVFEEELLTAYRACRGQSPADAELRYLSLVQTLPLYGSEMHACTGKDGTQYQLGLTPSGIVVYQQQDRIGLFNWQKITRIEVKSKKLTLVVLDKGEETLEHTFGFRCSSSRAARHVYSAAVTQHAFFRHSSSSRTNEPLPTGGERTHSLARLGSRYKLRGKSETEVVSQSALDAQFRRGSQPLERKPSQRHSRRKGKGQYKRSVSSEPVTTSREPASRRPSQTSIDSSNQPPPRQSQPTNQNPSNPTNQQAGFVARFGRSSSYREPRRRPDRFQTPPIPENWETQHRSDSSRLTDKPTSTGEPATFGSLDRASIRRPVASPRRQDVQAFTLAHPRRISPLVTESTQRYNQERYRDNINGRYRDIDGRYRDTRLADRTDSHSSLRSDASVANSVQFQDRPRCRSPYRELDTDSNNLETHRQLVDKPQNSPHKQKQVHFKLSPEMFGDGQQSYTQSFADRQTDRQTDRLSSVAYRERGVDVHHAARQSGAVRDGRNNGLNDLRTGNHGLDNGQVFGLVNGHSKDVTQAGEQTEGLVSRQAGNHDMMNGQTHPRPHPPPHPQTYRHPSHTHQLDSNGQTAGYWRQPNQSYGNGYGQPIGQGSKQPNGHIPQYGESYGHTNGQSYGQESRQLNGHLPQYGQSYGSSNGQRSGQPNGHIPQYGETNGQTNGQTNGPSTGPVNGPVNGPARRRPSSGYYGSGSESKLKPRRPYSAAGYKSQVKAALHHPAIDRCSPAPSDSSVSTLHSTQSYHLTHRHYPQPSPTIRSSQPSPTIRSSQPSPTIRGLQPAAGSGLPQPSGRTAFTTDV